MLNHRPMAIGTACKMHTTIQSNISARNWMILFRYIIVAYINSTMIFEKNSTSTTTTLTGKSDDVVGGDQQLSNINNNSAPICIAWNLSSSEIYSDLSNNHCESNTNVVIPFSNQFLQILDSSEMEVKYFRSRKLPKIAEENRRRRRRRRCLQTPSPGTGKFWNKQESSSQVASMVVFACLYLEYNCV